ncbi:MAG: SHOCT domain-containing protein [Marmoricola sp.]
MMDWYDHGSNSGGWIWMMLIMVVFWGLVVVALIALFRGTTRSGTTDGTAVREQDPLELLDSRFARGEIDAEEYHTRREALHEARSRSAR